MTPALLVHIQAHLDEDLSLDVLSAKASLSLAHFQRTFQALVGETPRNLWLEGFSGRSTVARLGQPLL